LHPEALLQYMQIAFMHVCQVRLLDCKVNFIFSLFCVKSAVRNRSLTGNLRLHILDCRCKEFTYKNCSQVSLFGGFSMHQDLYV